MQISAASAPFAHSPLSANPNVVTAQAAESSKTKRAPQNAEAANTQQKNQSQELSEDEKRQVSKLQDRDREVRAHEAAHLAAAGGLARGGASFSYQTGPDGRAYAVGGEVSIDTSPVSGDPQATIEKAKMIRAAALAPAQPSGADQAVAAAASKLETSARIELAAENAGEQQTTEEKSMDDSKDKAEEPSPTDIATRNADSAASRYQDTINPNAASDLVGQLLNTTA